MEDHPFPNLNISDLSFLNEIKERQSCSKCGKSRMYYCYSCFLPLDSLKTQLPNIKLPFKVEIVKHPGEVCGKSTAVHAAVLAPEDVTIHIYPDFPEFDFSRTVILYPCDESWNLKEYVSKYSNVTSNHGGKEQVRAPIERVIFIDSTWFQALKIFSDPRLKSITRVELDTHNTKFWRYQLDIPTTYLSTIEAIYYCVKEYNDLIEQFSISGKMCKEINSVKAPEIQDQSSCKTTGDISLTSEKESQLSHVSDILTNVTTETFDADPANNYDNLLSLFSFFYMKIRRTAAKEGRTLKSYEQPRINRRKIMS